ncbi:MAG: hypothetical protein QOE79_1278 [Sphingomonadales bacterium]|jgi:hypothetical protein|nr:hypothetical protein [Sphingomonadales bacterium]
MKIWAFLAIAAVASTPARADLTATYVAANPGMELKMKVEIAANGNLRTDMSVPGLYLIKGGGHSYLIMAGPAGPIVQDAADVGAVMRERLAQTDPHFCDAFAQAPATRLVSRGTTTISGRPGEAFAFDRPGSRTEVVISHDPALAPLAAAMAAQSRESMALMPCGPLPVFVQMQALLDSGAPLQFGPMQLDTVETGPIDPAHFVLPGAPLTREQVRAMMMKGAASTARPRPAD